MKLVSMSQTDYDVWYPRCRKQYILDKMRANGLTEKEAEDTADKDFERLIPEGLATKDNYFFSMKMDDGTVVGYAWFIVQGSSANRKAFICDIVVEEEFRGKGFGRKAMTDLETEAKKLGLVEMGLHVFAFNHTAIGLYRSLGYQATDLVMSKRI